MALDQMPPQQVGATPRLSLQELERVLWDAACELRAPVGTDRCKDYILPLLFFKRLSDVWMAERVEAMAELGADWSPEADLDYHSFNLPDGCLWTDIQEVTHDVGSHLYGMLAQIEQANHRLAGILTDASWANTHNLPESALLGVIRALSGLDLSPSSAPHDVIGRAYEYLLREFAEDSGNHAGEFYTPRDVVRLLVRLVEPHTEETIYDPTCGSGGMLLEAIQEVRDKGEDHRSMRLYGQEVRPDTATIARINMFLHGVDDFEIKKGDTLRDPLFRTGDQLQQFDVVLANPPFSLKNWGHENWAQDRFGRSQGGVPPKGFGDFAFIQHMIASLNEHGRAAVIMNHGVLFRGGQERKIRQWLIEQDLVEAVIDIPRNLFYATTIPNSLFVLRKNKPAERRGRVLFIDATKRVQPGKKINEMFEEDINAIVAAYRAGHDGDGVVVKVVTDAEIKERDWSFAFGQYIPQVLDEEIVDVATAMREWKEASAAAETARNRMLEAL